MKYSGKTYGFTLIELLVVVAIIGVLASVGLPMFQGYIDSSHRSSCLSKHDYLVNWFWHEMWECQTGKQISFDTPAHGYLPAGRVSYSCHGNWKFYADSSDKAWREKYTNPYKPSCDARKTNCMSVRGTKYSSSRSPELGVTNIYGYLDGANGHYVTFTSNCGSSSVKNSVVKGIGMS